MIPPQDGKKEASKKKENHDHLLVVFLKRFYLFIRERERESKWTQGERQRERENPKQAPCCT